MPLLIFESDCCRRPHVRFLFILFQLHVLLYPTSALSEGGGIEKMHDQMSRPTPALLETAYAGGESFRYSVTWMGLRAGELYMEIRKNSQSTYTVSTTAKTAGLLGTLFPVEDVFETTVAGEYRLPIRHTMFQKEGSRKNTKITTYDQDLFRVSYQKNQAPAEIFQTEGTMHNEFSSFLFLRTLSFSPGKNELVPTFADKKRNNVLVTVESKEKIRTILGEKDCLKVRPHLTFQGLYKKMGDPVIWLSDDTHRIPLKIKAKIIIGSLTATLEEYQADLQGDL